MVGMLYESKIGKKYQTVVPMMIRETAGIGEGDSLLWEVQQDGSILVRPQKSKTELLVSLNKEIRGSYDRAKKHVEEERNSWD
jgi:AbrB family looped-hinge helix DNA binding protein